MRKILVVVDGLSAAHTRDAVNQAISLYQQEAAEVHLLSVQPRVSGDVAMFFGSGELHDLQYVAGAEDLAPAQAQFDLAGVPYQTSVVVGRGAQSIAQRARELQCDRIVMGREGRESFAGRVFGSVAAQVRQLLGSGGEFQVVGS